MPLLRPPREVGLNMIYFMHHVAVLRFYPIHTLNVNRSSASWIVHA